MQWNTKCKLTVPLSHTNDYKQSFTYSGTVLRNSLLQSLGQAAILLAEFNLKYFVNKPATQLQIPGKIWLPLSDC